jgi:hypothetical protein
MDLHCAYKIPSAVFDFFKGKNFTSLLTRVSSAGGCIDGIIQQITSSNFQIISEKTVSCENVTWQSLIQPLEPSPWLAHPVACKISA